MNLAAMAVARSGKIGADFGRLTYGLGAGPHGYGKQVRAA
jgi:hypothetical protein